MLTMRIILIAAGTAGLIVFSRRSLLKPRSHGFPRLLAMEFLLVLIVLNLPRWFEDPFCVRQIASWVFLLLSIPLAIGGFESLRKLGGPRRDTGDDSNLAFENTSRLITTGIYGSIRHPMYASLLVLAAGVYLKDITITGSLLFAGIVLSLIATALIEEREDVTRFGPEYTVYCERTKMFVPYLF